MKQQKENNVTRLIALWETVLSDLQLPPLENNPIFVNRIDTEKNVFYISVQKEGCLPFRMKAGEQEYRVWLDEIPLTPFENTEELLEYPQWLDEVIMALLLNPTQITYTKSKSILEIFNEQGKVIDKQKFNPVKEVPYTDKEPIVRRFNPIRTYTYEEKFNLLFKQEIKYKEGLLSPEDVEKMISTQNILLSKSDRRSYYMGCWIIACFPILMIGIGLLDGMRNWSELFRMSITFSPVLLIAVLFYFIKKQRLKINHEYCIHTDEQFNEALKKTIKELQWKILGYGKNYVVAFHPQTGFSWGELIYLFRKKDYIYYKSLPNPDGKQSLTSFGWNKKNQQTFLKYLRQTTQKE